jgi:hypothetical protein
MPRNPLARRLASRRPKTSSVALFAFFILFLCPSPHAQAQQPGLPPGGYGTGFPVSFSSTKTSHGKPVIADLGLKPGHKSIIFGTFGHQLYVLNDDGSVASGFPVNLPGDVTSTPAVGDLDGDGKPEIVVGYGSLFETPSPGGVRAYKRNGTLLWQRVSGDFNGDSVPDPVISSPAIGDVDHDGLPDVAWGSLDGNVYLVRGADGVDKPGWPVDVRDTVFSSPALYDLNGDGKLEVIIGVDAHTDPTGFPGATLAGGYLHAIQYNGTELAGFPVYVDQVVISSPAVGDIDGDGKPEIVFGTGIFYCSPGNPCRPPNASHKLYAVRYNGAPQPGWPVSTDGQVITSPTLGDLDGDGILDVVATDDNTGPSATFHVYAWKGNGSLLWKRVPKSFFGVTPNAGNPLIADVLGDSAPEVIVPVNTELCVLSANGAQLTDDGTHPSGAFSFFTQTAVAGAASGTDGANVVLVTVSGTPFPSAPNTEVFVWKPKPAPAGCPGRGDADNNGILNIDDVLFLINHLFAGGRAPSSPCRADVNGDGSADVTDVFFLVNYLFSGGPPPPA